MRTREDIYQNRISRYNRFHQRIQKDFDRISYIRGASAALAILTFVIGVYIEPQSVYYGLALVSLAVFIIGVSIHKRLSGRIHQINTLLAINQEGLSRMQDRWADFRMTGEEFLDDRLPHLADLNLLGKNSLFQMIQQCSTLRGARTLADLLSSCDDFETVAPRQEAVKEIGPRRSMRQHLLMEGRLLGRPLDPNRFLEWIKTPSYLTRRPWLVVLQRVLVSATITLMLLDVFIEIRPFWILGLLLQAVVFAVTAGRCRHHYAPALSRDSLFLAYGNMFHLLESQRFRADYLARLHSLLFIGNKGISLQMKKLEKINSALSLCYGSIYPFVNMLLLWDIHFLYRLEKWKDSMTTSIDHCFEALAEMEALSSLAGFSDDHPDYAFPLIDPSNVPLSAEKLGHPLIPDPERVANDFEIPAEGFLALVTGSNMSGKSTFVRTVGINMALAFSGAPVAARRFAARPCRILTCIQVSDSIRLHISHFYAEVKSIKRILDSVGLRDGRPGAIPGLYLIDEIFSGTNTKERLIASGGIMLKLAASSSYGLVTTHDLELVALEDQSDRIKNFHFKDEIDENGQMVFHYQIHKGPVSSTNALELLKREGIKL
jgi:hypothetical protein